MTPWTRRETLLGVGGLVAAAGCTDAGSGGEDTPPPATEQPSDETASTDTTPTTTPGSPTDDPLDLREANVMAVDWDGEAGGDVEFSVTLYHDDEGEDGYANWWQVETLDGEQLGRRDLLHAHGTREFTRSGSYAVPAEVDCVVVRGHDQTHGYGGRIVVATLAEGVTRGIQQGPDPRSVSAVECP